MDTRQIICCLRDVGSFIGVFPSDLLPKYPIALSGTLIVNTEQHTESVSHWLAIHFQPRSSTAYYFDSYGLPPLIPSIQTFIRRNCTVWDYNSVQLQRSSTAVCVKYCCLFGLYMDRGYPPQQFVGLLDTMDTDRRVSEMLEAEFVPLPKMVRGGGGQCNVSTR
jgi:hypothetical protein